MSLILSTLSMLGVSTALSLDTSSSTTPSSPVDLSTGGNLGSESVAAGGDGKFYLGSLFAPALIEVSSEGTGPSYAAFADNSTGIDYDNFENKLYACGLFNADYQANLMTYDVDSQAQTSFDLAAATSGWASDYATPFGFFANDLTVSRTWTDWSPTVYVTVATAGLTADDSVAATGLLVAVRDGVSTVVASSDDNPNFTPKPFDLGGQTYYFGPSGVDSTFSGKALLMGAANRGEPDKALYKVTKSTGTVETVVLPPYDVTFAELLVGIDGLVVLPPTQWGSESAAVVAYIFNTNTYTVSTKVLKLTTADDWATAAYTGAFDTGTDTLASVTYTCSNRASFWSLHCAGMEVWVLDADLTGQRGGGELVKVQFE